MVSCQRLSILSYLSYLSYLSNQFIKSSLIKLWYAPFQVHGCIIHHGVGNVKQMFIFFKKNFRKFFKVMHNNAQGYSIYTPMYMAYFCFMRSFLYLTPCMVIPRSAAISERFMPFMQQLSVSSSRFVKCKSSSSLSALS